MWTHGSPESEGEDQVRLDSPSLPPAQEKFANGALLPRDSSSAADLFLESEMPLVGPAPMEVDPTVGSASC